MRTRRLSEVLVQIEAGRSFQTLERTAEPDELGVLKVSAVSWSNFNPNEAKAVLESHVPKPHEVVRAGDLLMSRANTQELVGAVVLAEQDFPFRLLSDKTLRLVAKPDVVDSQYLLFALRTTIARKHIEHFATGTSSSMRNIGQDAILAIPILMPESLEEQRRIATRLREQLAAVHAVRSAVAQLGNDLEAMPARLLADAFT